MTSQAKYLQKLLLIFTGILLSDQICKNIFLHVGNIHKNYNALFGMITNFSLAFVALLLFILIIFYEYKKKKQDNIFLFPLALILSGGISNAIDKIRLGFIIDYINFFNLFVFNLADLAILIGAIIVIWQIITE
jgi:signal peptidase II